MRGIRSTLRPLRRFLRGGYVFSCVMLLMLLALVLKDAGGVVWRSIYLALFLGAVLYEVMWHSDREDCLMVTGLMWIQVVLLCTLILAYGLVKGFILWEWPEYEIHMIITGLPYALMMGVWLSVLFMLVVAVIFQRN
ncbi:hypothetical protein A6858_27585 [Salmonella enterica]|nr:hypothetical protein [Salmonella enterica]HAC8268265.1 hypothetical protein [Salmonella enterica]